MTQCKAQSNQPIRLCSFHHLRRIRLNNLAQLKRRRKVLLLDKPSINQLPLLTRIRKLDLQEPSVSILQTKE